MAENLLRALAQVRRPAAGPRGAGPRGRLGPAEAGSTAVAPGRAAVRRPQGRPPPPGHGVRRDAGAHPQPRRRATAARGRGRRAAGRAVRQLARRDGHRDRAAAGDQARARRVVHTSARTSRPRSTAATTATRSGCCPRTTRCSGRSGWPTRDGRIKPSRQAKYRQVEEFLRLLDAAVDRRRCDKGHLRRPTARGPAAGRRPRLRQRLPDLRGAPVPHRRARAAGAPHRRRRQGAVPRAQHRGRRRARHRRRRSWSAASPASTLDPAPEVVLALHACDTATDEALARAVEWEAPLVLAAPCCHHDVAAQLRKAPTPAPYAMLTRHGILRERLADTLTDALRASLMRLQGYRVDVVQFVESKHTPRNTLLRATRTGAPVAGGSRPAGVRRAGRGLGHPPAAGRAARRRPCAERSLAGLLVVPFLLGRGRARRRTRRSVVFSLPGPRRSSSPAGSRSPADCWSPPTTRATPAGSSPSTPPARRSAPPAGPTTRRTSRRWPRRTTTTSGSATSATTPGRATPSRSRRCRSGAATATPTVRSYELVYPDGARDAESLLSDPITGRLYVATQGDLRRHALRRADRARPGRRQPAARARRRTADRHRRSVLPRRPAPRGPQLRGGRGLRLPVARAGRRVPAPRAAAGRGPRGRHATAACCVSSEGQHTEVLRVPLPRRRARRWLRPPPSPSAPPASAPRTESREDTRAARDHRRPSGRPGRGSSAG